MTALLTIIAIFAWIIPCFIMVGITAALIGLLMRSVLCHLFTIGLIGAICMAVYFVCLY